MQKSSIGIPVIAAAALAVVAATPTGYSDSALTGCPKTTPQRVPTTVLIRNHNPLDVEVFAVTEAGRRYRLGSVQSGAGRTFDLPRGLCECGDLYRLKVYSIARNVGPSLANRYLDAVKTQPLSVDRDGEIVLQVQRPLSASFIDRGP
jgi:hypothetical protein